MGKVYKARHTRYRPSSTRYSEGADRAVRLLHASIEVQRFLAHGRQVGAGALMGFRSGYERW
jgi:hypothetical protein